MKRAAAGVYMFIHKVGRKVYVGSSVAVSRRKSAHIRCLRDGSHKNVKLQHDWTIDGEDAFEFYFVEAVSEEHALKQREQFWIEKVGALNYGYNVRCAVGPVQVEMAVSPSKVARAKVAPANAVKTVTKTAFVCPIGALIVASTTSDSMRRERRSGIDRRSGVDRRQR